MLYLNSEQEVSNVNNQGASDISPKTTRTTIKKNLINGSQMTESSIPAIPQTFNLQLGETQPGFPNNNIGSDIDFDFDLNTGKFFFNFSKIRYF